jgi:hypothetical protein
MTPQRIEYCWTHNLCPCDVCETSRRTADSQDRPMLPKETEPMDEMTAHVDRLRAMIDKDQQTWDLSPNDVAAIHGALEQITRLTTFAAAVRKQRDRLEQIVADYPSRRPEYLMAVAILDALDTLDALEEGETP